MPLQARSSFQKVVLDSFLRCQFIVVVVDVRRNVRGTGGVEGWVGRFLTHALHFNGPFQIEFFW